MSNGPESRGAMPEGVRMSASQKEANAQERHIKDNIIGKAKSLSELCDNLSRLCQMLPKDDSKKFFFESSLEQIELLHEEVVQRIKKNEDVSLIVGDIMSKLPYFGENGIISTRYGLLGNVERLLTQLQMGHTNLDKGRDAGVDIFINLERNI